MDVKGEVLLQLFNKSKFKKLGFSAPLKIFEALRVASPDERASMRSAAVWFPIEIVTQASSIVVRIKLLYHIKTEDGIS